MQAITNVHSSIWSDIENRLTPLPDGSKNWKIIQIFPLLLEIPLGVCCSMIHAVNKTIAYLTSFSPWPKLSDAKKDFSTVLIDHRKWEDDLSNEVLHNPLGKEMPQLLFGVATCTYQDSGSSHCPDSQWAEWEKKKVLEDNRSFKSANLFGLYQTEFGRAQISEALQKMGVNSYRFSIEWSHIEPQEGIWNEQNLKVYVDLCKHLRDQGITPMVTLHHFSEPNWFHKKGSFANEENIDAFLRFAEKVFEPLTEDYHGKPLVEHFCTINEPAIDAFSRFVRGAFSPGLFCRFKTAGQFLKGALKAHCIVYNRLKKQAPHIQIGIVHQYLKFIPTNPLLFPIAHYLNRLINETALAFFRTGNFQFKMPFICNIRGIPGDMPKPKTDFVGLQYYTRPLIGLAGSTCNFLYGERMTQMPFRDDPEGLYEAMIETHKAYKAPVIITENGISTHNEVQRSTYVNCALYAAYRAAKEIGVKNFLGYYLWCLTDNFEWDMGMKPQAFGAFPLGKFTLKEGIANSYTHLLNRWKRNVSFEPVIAS